MTTLQEQNKAIVRRFNREFIQGGDVSVFDQIVSPDFVNHSAQPGMPADAAGAAYFFMRVLRPAFPDLQVTINDQTAEGDKVVTHKTYEGTHGGPFLGFEPTGRRVRFDVIDIFVLRDGMYVEHWTVADLLGLSRQLAPGDRA